MPIPVSFENSLSALGIQRLTPLRFRDHHRYSQKDMNQILRLGQKYDLIITTEKDWVKINQANEPLSESQSLCGGKTDHLFYLKIKLETSGLAKKNQI